MTDVNFDSIFSQLNSAAAELNNTSELANQALAETESRLVELNIGIEVWYPTGIARTDSIGGGGAHDSREHFVDVLGFARVDGSWCLAVKKIKRVSGFFEGDTGCPYVDEFLESPAAPLLKQSRALRIGALATLPNFLEHFEEQVQAVNHELGQAMAKLAR